MSRFRRRYINMDVPNKKPSLVVDDFFVCKYVSARVIADYSFFSDDLPRLDVGYRTN